VILGITSIDDFQTYLVRNKYTVDAQAVLLAELRDAVTEAEAARAKRAAAAGATVETRVPLATVARAARLGIVTPDVYEQRLTDAGYTDDDIAIEWICSPWKSPTSRRRARAPMRRKRRPKIAGCRSTSSRGPSSWASPRSTTTARARSRSTTPRPTSIPSSPCSTADVQAVRDAEARRATIDGQLKSRNLSLSELEAAVKAGQMTIDAYTARLVALGYGSDDADLLTTLLTLKLPAPPEGVAVEWSPKRFVGVAVTSRSFCSASTYQCGRLSARVESLEQWRARMDTRSTASTTGCGDRAAHQREDVNMLRFKPEVRIGVFTDALDIMLVVAAEWSLLHKLDVVSTRSPTTRRAASPTRCTNSTWRSTASRSATWRQTGSRSRTISASSCRPGSTSCSRARTCTSNATRTGRR
jgi:hypothetical protein